MRLNNLAFTARLHSSWSLAIFSASIVVGVTLASSMAMAITDIYVVISVLCAMYVVSSQRMMLLPILIICGCVIGIWRGSIEQYDLENYNNIVNSKVIMRGMVSEDPDIGKSSESLLRLKNISVDGTSYNGKVWVSTQSKIDIKRGDIVEAYGKVGEGFGSFSVTIYRATINRAERPVPGDVARRVRDWFADSVRMAIPEPQSSLGIGYILGQRRSLPPDLSESLQIAGLTHIVVASGYNLTILVRLARRLFAKVSKYSAALAAMAMIVSFVAITGASPSMSRAGLVATLSLAAWYYGRSFHPLVLLPFSAAVTVMIEPSFAWGDLGWQLSFLAFAGVMILAPLLQRYFYGPDKPGAIKQILGETISAQVVTFPVLLLAFGQISNVAIIANLLVLPLVPLAMLLTFTTGVMSLVAPAAAEIFGLPAYWLLGYMTTITELLAGLPWAQSTATINIAVMYGMYAVIIVVCIYLWRATGYNLRDSNLIE